MQRWEFLFVRAIRTQEAIEVETNGHKMERTFEDLADFYALCNQIGDKGWELVSERQVSAGSVQVVFKKPKQ